MTVWEGGVPRVEWLRDLTILLLDPLLSPPSPGSTPFSTGTGNFTISAPTGARRIAVPTYGLSAGSIAPRYTGVVVVELPEHSTLPQHYTVSE